MPNDTITDERVPLLTPLAPEMRRVLGHFCTGIAVITAHDGTRPIGFTCQSVTSVSLDPPYVSFCPANTSTSWPAIREVGAVSLNILADTQREVCSQFASSGGDKFDGVRWHQGANGAPVLHGTLASIEAEVEFTHPAGDHTIVVARVTGLWAHCERRPLLFFRGSYSALGGLSDV
ncbi:flavin reductase family protein [Mycolicibacterium komossense]|uniref:Flavin reductase family protein n=1 Tax=Mycolicibacterium komossense TaxID=1779 RepID=A0ABT3CJN5_9MYCO|nr:flavin reductase family protein [Mycolicibacterium komossense]MCV7229572.1 flavin reductase family protein [Mycolicibacterium komossense]